MPARFFALHFLFFLLTAAPFPPSFPSVSPDLPAFRLFTDADKLLVAAGLSNKLGMKGNGFDLDVNTNKVYGVVMTTADGSEYGLYHVTNIWRGTELGFNADETYYTSMIGKTVTRITYYTANGVYVLPVNVTIPALAD